MTQHYQQGENLEEHQFKPTYTPDLTSRLIKQYYDKPKSFNDDLISQLENHATHYGMWFNRDPSDEDFIMIEAVKHEFLSWFAVQWHPERTDEGLGRALPREWLRKELQNVQ